MIFEVCALLFSLNTFFRFWIAYSVVLIKKIYLFYLKMSDRRIGRELMSYSNRKFPVLFRHGLVFFSASVDCKCISEDK